MKNKQEEILKKIESMNCDCFVIFIKPGFPGTVCKKRMKEVKDILDGEKPRVNDPIGSF